MEKYIGILKQNPLFAGIEESETLSLFKCLNAHNRKYDKDEYIINAGDFVKNVGIVVKGNVLVIQEDYWGNRLILANIEEGGLFAEAFSCAEVDSIPVSVIASEKTEVLLIDYKRIITTCNSVCTFHTSLIKNMLKIVAQKNINLTQKIEIVTMPTTRDRILAYLSFQAMQNGNSSFAIPFDRQELADYLSVNRSAMSRELSSLKAEGLIETERNTFKLLI